MTGVPVCWVVMVVDAAERGRRSGVIIITVVAVVVKVVVLVVRGGKGSSGWRGRPHQGGRQRGVVGRDPLNHPLIPLTRGPSTPPAPAVPPCPEWEGVRE